MGLASLLWYQILLLVPYWAVCIEFPNSIIGTPKVECLMDSIKLIIETTSGNPSHIFVKGRNSENSCNADGTNVFSIRQDQCGVTRERSLNPAGVFYKVCVVVQMHPLFITKVDRTFCASCFYMETVKELTQELGVSQMSSTEVAVSFAMPACVYSIKRNSQTGPDVRFATVGEPVFHVWTCPSDAYGILVQNCYVDDGQGNKILIIDQNGCGVDQYVIRTPNYNTELTQAYQESHVFKFADKTITRFTCQLKICIKAGDGCRGVSPPTQCSTDTSRPRPPASSPAATTSAPHNAVVRPQLENVANSQGTSDAGGRNISSTPANATNATTPGEVLPALNDSKSEALTSEDGLIDVSGELLVFGDAGHSADKQFYEDLLNDLASGNLKNYVKRQDHVCMSTAGFGAMITFVVSLVAAAFAYAIVATYRNRWRCRETKKPKKATSH